MTLNEFVAGVAEQFEDTNPAEIQPGTRYQELDEWSSLVAMTLVAFVKTEFNKSLSGKEIKDCNTIEELYNLISTK
ncbi:MAG: phosphopantetheine-binding protein [Akkermansia sp.]|nr:phosphopantetheine-binding protein [Akkermansia sp.]